MQENINFRASPIMLARIDRLAGARKVSRSAAINAAIVEATVPEYATPIADENEVLELLSVAARGGSVSAMKVLLAHHRLPRPVEVDPESAAFVYGRPASNKCNEGRKACC
jgi:hypothetical protein